jgi:tetratricopeptide (TPR) repeat protein
MTSETYMVVDPRRDHSFRVPRPDLTVDLGTPNACNGCHTKPTEDAAWADDKIHQWRGKERDAPRHFAYAIHAAETGQPGAAEQLAEVLRNPREPAIVRATAAVLLGRVGDGTVTSAQRAALRDVNPLVRAAAVESLPAMSPLDVESLLAARLGDTSRSVRVVAAAQMLRHMSAGGTTAESLPNSARANWETALGEYRDAQELVLDQGAGNINLAEMNLMLNRPQEALQLYGRAVEIAPYLAGPRDRLAMLLGDNPAYADQVRTLREEEVKLLTRNCELLPGAADPRYNLGRMHYLLGNLDASQAAMDEACRLAPESYDIRWFTTLLLEHRAKLQPTAAAWDAAIESAGALDVIRPGDAVARQLLQNFAARRRAVGGP